MEAAIIVGLVASHSLTKYVGYMQANFGTRSMKYKPTTCKYS